MAAWLCLLWLSLLSASNPKMFPSQKLLIPLHPLNISPHCFPPQMHDFTFINVKSHLTSLTQSPILSRSRWRDCTSLVVLIFLLSLVSSANIDILMVIPSPISLINILHNSDPWMDVCGIPLINCYSLYLVLKPSLYPDTYIFLNRYCFKIMYWLPWLWNFGDGDKIWKLIRYRAEMTGPSLGLHLATYYWSWWKSQGNVRMGI